MELSNFRNSGYSPQPHLCDTIRHTAENCPLVLPGQLRVEGENSVTWRSKFGVLLEVGHQGKDLAPSRQEDQNSPRQIKGLNVGEQGADEVEGELSFPQGGHG